MPGKYKFNDERKKIFLNYILNGHTRTSAAKSTGIDMVTVREHERLFPDFHDALIEAEVDACGEVESALRKLAVEERHFGAISKWLDNRDPDRWKDMRRPDRVSINVNNQLDAGSLVDSIAALQEKLIQRQELRGLPEYVEEAEIVERDN